MVGARQLDEQGVIEITLDVFWRKGDLTRGVAVTARAGYGRKQLEDAAATFVDVPVGNAREGGGRCRARARM
jgi:hypothetical protein